MDYQWINHYLMTYRKPFENIYSFLILFEFHNLTKIYSVMHKMYAVKFNEIT